MKTVTILSLLLLTSAAFGELTKEDLHDLKEDLHKVIKEEIIASEKRTREYIDLKVETINAKIDAVNTRIDALEKSVNSRFDAVDNRFGAVDKKLDWMWYMMIALIGLVTAAIAAPQIIVAYRDRGRQEMQTQQQALQTQIDQLRKELEALQQ